MFRGGEYNGFKKSSKSYISWRHSIPASVLRGISIVETSLSKSSNSEDREHKQNTSVNVDPYLSVPYALVP